MCMGWGEMVVVGVGGIGADQLNHYIISIVPLLPYIPPSSIIAGMTIKVKGGAVLPEHLSPDKWLNLVGNIYFVKSFGTIVE